MKIEIKNRVRDVTKTGTEYNESLDVVFNYYLIEFSMATVCQEYKCKTTLKVGGDPGTEQMESMIKHDIYRGVKREL